MSLRAGCASSTSTHLHTPNNQTPGPVCLIPRCQKQAHFSLRCPSAHPRSDTPVPTPAPPRRARSAAAAASTSLDVAVAVALDDGGHVGEDVSANNCVAEEDKEDEELHNSEPREALVVDEHSVAVAIAALGDGIKDAPQKEAKEGQTTEEDQANQATHDAEDDSSLVTE